MLNMDIINDIRRERKRQDDKWGVQRHAFVCPMLMNRPGGATPQRFAEDLGIPTADRSRQLCQFAAEQGYISWSHILTEELCESVEAFALGDLHDARKELIETIAVAVAMIEHIDEDQHQIDMDERAIK